MNGGTRATTPGERNPLLGASENKGSSRFCGVNESEREFLVCPGSTRQEKRHGAYDCRLQVQRLIFVCEEHFYFDSTPKSNLFGQVLLGGQGLKHLEISCSVYSITSPVTYKGFQTRQGSFFFRTIAFEYGFFLPESDDD